MREQQSGRIINVSSVGGKFYEPLGAWYHATKFAVEGFSDSLRLELAPYGVRVVIVEPGPIRTEWNELARAHLVSSSAGTAYEHQAEGVRARMQAGDGPMMSGPDVVGRKIARAATARRPRTRYPVGRGARSVVTARRLLPDRALDAVIGRLYS
jgi:NAD(P)-dependent dehydrogenase (short-subunit alcohol dehydrogenase family)